MHKRIVTICVLLLSGLIAKGGEVDHLFTVSNSNMNTSNYAAALAGYHKIEMSGSKTSGLYNNIGCVYYKAHDYGRAVLYFEKGLKLSPLDTQLVYNRNKVLKQLHKAIAANNLSFGSDESSFFSRVDRLNKISIIIIVVSGLLFLVLSFFSAKKPILIVTSICKILAAASAIILVIAGVLFKQHEAKRYAIITTPVSAIRLGPAKLATVDRYFNEGYKVEVINQYKHWYEVKDHADRSGWIYGNDLTEIR
ncbi:MAG TPA: tetratricopeptide repeat protein [Mucilaginibacter sp.]|nr:tetratricopeptide repeat protein [Mucilaginibacter sp.]